MYEKMEYIIGIIQMIIMGSLYLFIEDFFATQIIGGAKELVVLCVIKWRHLI